MSKFSVLLPLVPFVSAAIFGYLSADYWVTPKLQVTALQEILCGVFCLSIFSCFIVMGVVIDNIRKERRDAKTGNSWFSE
jgi:hypothetical protein